MAPLWEHTDYVLVAANGQRQVLAAEPQFGPGLQRFAVVSAGIENGVLPNTIELFQWQNGGFTKVWETTPEDREPAEVAWTAANTLVLRKRTWMNAGAEGYGYARLAIR